jgi:large subunit ribosomal protein L16
MFYNLKKLNTRKLKGKLVRLEFKSNVLKFGTIGLKAAESGIINSRQIEAARQAIVRKIKRKGKIWIKIFPDLPITSKAIGVRMGKGKGPVSHWELESGEVMYYLKFAGLIHNCCFKDWRCKATYTN